MSARYPKEYEVFRQKLVQEQVQKDLINRQETGFRLGDEGSDVTLSPERKPHKIEVGDTMDISFNALLQFLKSKF